MSDVQRDLYSFLRSKDLFDSDRDPDGAGDEADAPESDGSRSEGHLPDGPDDAATAVDGPDFDDPRVGERLRELAREQLHALPYGVICLDDDGVVQLYNQTESELSGVDPEDAIGQNFFTYLAPCSNNRLFLGRFRQGIQSDDLDERFTYTFTYKMRPTLVDIRLYRDDEGTNWLLVKRR